MKDQRALFLWEAAKCCVQWRIHLNVLCIRRVTGQQGHYYELLAISFYQNPKAVADGWS